MPDQAEKLRLLAREQEPEVLPGASRAHVVAITSGKGGVGKTNLSVNLAIALAQGGRRVALFDADLGLANAQVLLDVAYRFNLSHVLDGRRELSEILIPAPGNITLVPGGSGVTQLADVSDTERDRLIRRLRLLEDQFDVLVIDTGAGISRNTINFALLGTEILVVSTPETTAITDAYATIKVISRRDAEANLKLVVNFAENAATARKVAVGIANTCSQFLDTFVGDAGHLLQDPHVSQAVRRRRPFLLEFPNCPASRCVTAIAGRLAAGSAGAASQGQGFLHRLVALFAG